MIAQSLIGLAFLGMTPNGYGMPNVNDTMFLERSYSDFDVQTVALLSREATGAPTGIKIPIFRDSEFPFVTIIRDNGTGKGGGWQEARANLEFIKVEFPIRVRRWKCPITIGMPFRTEKMGIITPSLAASMSSGITNMVTIGMDFELPQGIFCDTFVKGVLVTFKATYPNLGSRVT